ncbi:MAG: hypothetical protein JWM75_3056 [Sphingomonas bacterium]|nr:hypothetical protein [Sphingomonas bacterium]
MATLILTAVGTALGGPIGGAIGALIGQSVDRRMLAPKGRRGPRLGDLTVQTSTYGSAIPKLFGRMRVAGTVIWATDLKEDRAISGGKGQPSTTEYSYSASFAVALSARPIVAVHRIWADGKLLRGAAGDWKTQTGFRLYLGGEDQAVDPLIASAEGLGGTPAYRGTAYAVFEHLQLADFGNRIPSLTFEVEADQSAVPLGTVADELSQGAVRGELPASVEGFAASGDSVRGALEALSSLAALSVVDQGEQLLLRSLPAAALLSEDALGATAGSELRARVELDREAPGTLPDEIAISYYEPSRDYQAGLQRARRGGPGRRVESIDLPAALSADGAKAAAERLLARAWAERVHATVALPIRHMTLRPGSAVRLPGRAELFRIASWTLAHMVLELKLVGVPTAPAAPATASPGRPSAEADQQAGETLLELLDLPPLQETALAAPMLWIAAAGTEPGWRKAQLLTSLDAGASFRPLGMTAKPAVMGVAIEALGEGEPALFDRRLSVDVALANLSMWLESRDDDALVNGANLAMLGDELIQFGAAQPIGGGHFRISRLLRGRRGTEWAMATHAAGERFVLIDAATLVPFQAPLSALGTTARVLAAGVGDTVATVRETVISGAAVRPPSPVHITAARGEDGTVRVRWVRRSRTGWAWLDGGDAPLGEENERYRLTILHAGLAVRTVETPIAEYDYTIAAQAADGVGASDPVQLHIAQMGVVAPSLPVARRNITI